MAGIDGFRHERQNSRLTEETLKAFHETWLLRRPKCGNRRGFLNEDGQIESAIALNHRPREDALRQDYIQLNHGRAITMMAFDVDDDYSVEGIAEKVVEWGMTPPNMVVRNPQSGHCHAIYFISGKILNDSITPGPSMRFLEAVRETMTAVLDADPNYTGMLVQNPLSPRWELHVGGGTRHNLSDLMYNFRRIMLEHGIGKAVRRQMSPLEGDWDSEGAAEGSRNCMMFESLMKIVPREYREQGYPTGLERRAFTQSIDKMARGPLNRDVALLAGKAPMRDSEVRGIVKSVTSYIFRNNNEVRFLAHQRVKGRLRRKVDHERVIQQYTRHNRPISHLAQEYRVSYSAIYRILRVNGIKVEGKQQVRKWTAVSRKLELLLVSASARDDVRKHLGTDDEREIATFRVRMSRVKKEFPIWWDILSTKGHRARSRLVRYIQGMLQGKIPMCNLDEHRIVCDLMDQDGFWDEINRVAVEGKPSELITTHQQRKRQIRLSFWKEVLKEEQAIRAEFDLAA